VSARESERDAPAVPPAAGEPGTVAVTLPESKGKPTYEADLAGAPPKLRVDHVSVTYVSRDGTETEAVRDVSFDIVDKPGVGEIVVFLGPSGCGKSTILKAVAGLLVPTQGQVLVDGRPVLDVGRDRGMVFQAYTSFGWLSVRDNVEYGLKLRGVPKAERRQQSDKYLKAVGLQDFAGRYPTLDPQTRWGMQGLLLDVAKSEDNTTLFVTHDVSEAVYLADTVYVLSSRPARILHAVTVPSFRERDFKLKSAPEFRAVEKQLLDLLYTTPAK
jgi:NitT/TauT family transport system ATP-binding protein